MTNLRLSLILIVSLIVIAFTHNASAQSLVILTPDGVTGEVTFKVNTATDDVRVIDTCIFRTDDPSLPIACVPVSSGRAPATPGETAPSGEGVVLEIPVVVSILSEDQTFGAKNIAVVDGQRIPSLFSSNSALLPMAVVAPLFIVPGS